MLIQRDQQLHGVDAVALRAMLRELQRAGCTQSLLEADVVSAFDVAAAGAAEVVERLRTAGVVALVPAVDQDLYRCGDGEQGQLIWKTGVAGNAIAKARTVNECHALMGSGCWRVFLCG